MPLQVSDGVGVSRLQLTLRCESSLLEVQEFTPSSSLVARGAQAQFQVVSPGTATLNITAASGFAAASGPKNASAGISDSRLSKYAAFARRRLSWGSSALKGLWSIRPSIARGAGVCGRKGLWSGGGDEPPPAPPFLLPKWRSKCAGCGAFA
jgi:hypothetical protein